MAMEIRIAPIKISEIIKKVTDIIKAAINVIFVIVGGIISEKASEETMRRKKNAALKTSICDNSKNTFLNCGFWI